MQITPSTTPKEISKYIAGLREQKGKEREVLSILDKALMYGNDFIINLFWEKALTYQHLVMVEDAKGEGADILSRKKNIMAMEETVKLAKYFIVRYDLEKWKGRLYRFLGRVSDYRKDFKRAVSYYKTSLKHIKTDPEYLGKRYPRWLEVEAFLSYSLMMSGKVGKGHTYAREVYFKFDHDKEALTLKDNDYVTWAIWKSGIPVRTINALLENKMIFDKNEALSWLNESQQLLVPIKMFGYRLDEIENIKKKLRKD